MRDDAEVVVRRGPIAALALAIGLASVLLGLGTVPGGAASADPRVVLTLVGADGHLWALPEDGPPAIVRRNVAATGVINDLAWHPSRPEVLLVRQKMEADPTLEEQFEEPFDALVRLDLKSGKEEVVVDQIGPQARVLGPRFGPDGAWGYARIECCLSREILFFGSMGGPGGQTRQVATDRFLPAEVRDFTLATAGPVAADGRILVAVECCVGDEPKDDPSGLYLVTPDLEKSERLTRGQPVTPAGLGPGNAWVAGFKRAQEGEWNPSLVRIALPSGTERTLIPGGGLRLVDKGEVAEDGTIAMGTIQEDPGLQLKLVDVWTVGPDGQNRRNVTNGRFAGATAFAWAPREIVLQLTASSESGS